VLLAFDTSSPVVTVAVADPAGDRVLAAASVSDGLRHGELLAPAIRSVLAEAGVRPSGLTTIAVGAGPGPFTGLRVGLVTALTMADLLGIEAVGVCSLDVVARATAVAGPVAVATDARRKEIYWAVYDAPAADSSRRRIEGPAVDKPAAVAHVFGDLPLVGHGAILYAGLLGDRFVAGGPEYPSAAVLARGVLVGSLELLPPEPLYLRRPDVTLSAGPKSVLR
jgi:tRNA threonylcarbamoyl adenosine modification protein YeaZ